MGKALVITEKPSVAADIAKALGRFQQKGNYYENEKYVIGWAVGHLLELALPGEIDQKHKKWGLEELPILPESFPLKPVEKHREQLDCLLKLLSRPDIELVINACDAGREGELIFQYLWRYASVNKPVARLWLQSMTVDAIGEAFRRLRSSEEMRALADAAVSRSESDWLVGINGTRALTAVRSRPGGFALTPVGRVQTPTLAIVVERDRRIFRFPSRPYWRLEGTFQWEGGTYRGRWWDPEVSQGQREESDEGVGRPDRIWDKAKAEEIYQKCLGKTGQAREERKSVQQSSPLLFDLTSLQREANNRFGWSAARTLDVLQALYEKHKAVTYPRTDSRCLPEDYVVVAERVLRDLSSGRWGSFIEPVLRGGWVGPDKRIFNNAKVTDHFAIIPTGHTPSGLSPAEERLFELVVKRFVAAFYPPARWETVVRFTQVEGEVFRSEGRRLVEAGWMVVYGREEEIGQEEELPPLPAHARVVVQSLELVEDSTQPPPYFTEATLLAAMENAGKLVEDEVLREAMAKKGLGTPATRAAIIEGLVEEKYLGRFGRELFATPKAFLLLELLQAAGIPALSSAEMTGEWEFKLQQMERGKLPRSLFMSEIRDLTQQVVAKAKGFLEKGTYYRSFAGRSPLDGSPMVETLEDYRTLDGSYRLPKYIAGRPLEPDEALALLERGRVGPLRGFRSRKGKPFEAVVRLAPGGKVELEFPSQPEDPTKGDSQALPEGDPLGFCPVDGSPVFETASDYRCQKATQGGEGCSFRLSKQILGRPIPREQVKKLLEEGKTDLLAGFYSQKRRRKFRAQLVWKDGKLGFVFPESFRRKKGSKQGKNP
ncbi:DNA topoisomerase 3 [Candidatus Methylacidithermus pantelleriae]|uniref:DNA topoisomerase n=1 Tax=Candidatus Methylacidithermus pantelleriae TaxID=2744239 RepID=A0A8J2BKD1_9BACT|nr:DNA topoisomerase 3 [Candidatus Methylacidithermus pantelleriae]CAF0689580.1 DNA topoisomerase III [Candidatus Methylacidithermus pantelleriae]